MNSSTSTAAPIRLSVILPAYNEQDVIEQSVRQFAGIIRPLVEWFEIIVTNDGSRDNTREVLRDLQQSAPELNLRVITHSTNRGYGAALASGFDAARGDYLFFTDGDLQFDLKEINMFLPYAVAGKDLVIGWRRKRADPPMRLANAFGWKLLVNGLFGYTAKDIDCAFKLFRRQVWEAVNVHATGATFSAEFLVKARRLGFNVTELPVSHYPRTRGSATGAKPAVILRAFREVFALRRNLNSELAWESRARRRTVEPEAAPRLAGSGRIPVESGSAVSSGSRHEQPVVNVS